MAVAGLPGVVALLADGQSRTGPELAQLLGVSRAAVWKQVQALRSAGLDVVTDAGGYRLAAPLDRLDPAAIRHILPKACAARTGVLETHWRVDSTQSVIARRVADLPDLSFVFAEWQQAGRGRRGRVWHSPPAANLQFSCLKRFTGGYAALAGLSLAVGVAAVRALSSAGVHGITLKWPNDIVVGDAKLGGILVELGGEFLGPCHAIIGIGINVRVSAALRAQLDRPCADVVELCSGPPPTRSRLAAALIEQLVDALTVFDSEGFAAFHDDWMRLDALAGRRIRAFGAHTAIEGTGVGVDTRGALQIRTATGVQTVDSGEVSVRPA